MASELFLGLYCPSGFGGDQAPVLRRQLSALTVVPLVAAALRSLHAVASCHGCGEDPAGAGKAALTPGLRRSFAVNGLRWNLAPRQLRKDERTQKRGSFMTWIKPHDWPPVFHLPTCQALKCCDFVIKNSTPNWQVLTPTYVGFLYPCCLLNRGLFREEHGVW